MSDTPTLNFGLVDLSDGQFPVQVNEGFENLLDQAVSGGVGTQNYLQHFQAFANLSQYLNDAGTAAYTQRASADNGQQLIASDGSATLTINANLSPQLTPQDYNQTPIVGMATVQMALPDPYDIVKVAVLGVSIAELPPGFVVTNAIWESLFSPILQRVQSFVQSSFENWAGIDTSDVEAIGDAVIEGAGEAADDASAETAEVIADEVLVAELAIDFSVAVPAFAAVGFLVAIPLLLGAIAKEMEIQVQINNFTSSDFTWSVPYVDEGTVTVQPQSSVIPAMGFYTDMFGDKSTVTVAQQAQLSYVNTSGFEGIGFVIHLVPGCEEDEDIAAVISVPFIDNNSVWLGDPGSTPNWPSIYNAHQDDGSGLTTQYGNRLFSTEIALDALSGNNDNYHCVMRIREL